MSWTYVLIAHGTVSDLKELPEFLLEIRRGRPVPEKLLHEMEHRYAAVGGSPLLQHTQEQADALEKFTGVPCRVAMRLWSPRFRDVIADLGSGDRVCLLPIAPFSVSIYEQAARQELEQVRATNDSNLPELTCIEPWGDAPSLIAAYQEGIKKALLRSQGKVEIILTAHSLPMFVINSGDPYQKDFEAMAHAVADGFSEPVSICYQSQGEGGGQWLGPSLEGCIQDAQARGAETIVVSPIGFLTEHIETLYDLDVETAALCEKLGVQLQRVPAVGHHPGVIEALANAAAQACTRLERAKI